MSLLDEAKKLNVCIRKNISDEQIELGLAWLKGEISLVAVQKVINPKNPRGLMVYTFLVKVLKIAYEKGLIEIKATPERN